MSTTPSNQDGPSGSATSHRLVRESYGRAASSGGAGSDAREHAQNIGYDRAQLEGVPEEANLGLGCGNPTALAQLKPGEIVVDLGSGGGLDALIAGDAVGAEGRVIGIDTTPEMLERARDAASKGGLSRTVEFREGIIEALPVVSNSVDVILSNCVINLSPDKPRVFKEAFRVLKAGGRLAVSDMLLTKELPPAVAPLADVYTGGAGGVLADEYLAAIVDAGFVDVTFTRSGLGCFLETAIADPTIIGFIEEVGMEEALRVANTVFSYSIEARKPTAEEPSESVH